MHRREMVEAVNVFEPLIKRVHDKRDKKAAVAALKKLLDGCRLWEAVENAAEFLPEGFEILIAIEQGSGTIKLIDNVGFDYVIDGGETMADNIDLAVEQANDPEVKGK